MCDVIIFVQPKSNSITGLILCFELGFLLCAFETSIIRAESVEEVGLSAGDKDNDGAQLDEALRDESSDAIPSSYEQTDKN